MASSTKPVLGVAAMMMIEEGLMSPNDPVSKYIPEFADMKVAIPIESAKKDVTAKHKSKEEGKGKVPENRLVPVDTPVTMIYSEWSEASELSCMQTSHLHLIERHTPTLFQRCNYHAATFRTKGETPWFV